MISTDIIISKTTKVPDNNITYSCLIVTYAQILYQCNFDNDTIITSCLKPEQLAGLLISEQLGSAGIQPPFSPLSDVTSSLKPTSNGKSCSLPYHLNSFTWDMYFCNEGYCQISIDSTSKCSSGQFGYFNFQAPRKVSFTLNTASGGTNGTDEQCLIYYYYLSNITGIDLSITIRKQEVGDTSKTIDSVASSPYNGWIKRQVSFHTSKGGYKIYFDFEKTSGLPSLTTVIGIDEISVHQRNCPSEPTTESTLTISTTESDITTSNIIETISTIQTTDTTVTESSSMEPITATATATITTTTSSTTTSTTSATTTTTTTTTTTASTTTIIASTSTSTTLTTTTALTTTSATTTTTSASTTISTTTTTTTSTTTTTTTTVITTTTAATTTTTTASTTISTSTTTSIPTTVITTTIATTSTSTQTTTTTSTTSTSSGAITTTTTMLTTATTVMTNQPSSITMITNSTSDLTESTTADSLENTTKKDPSKRTLIIALATGIPAALIIVVIIGVWIKRSAVGGLLSGISHPFTDITDQNEMTTFKLNDLQDDHAF
ncbi:unnamed protein product [Adineta steineri]|uniref:MAM domain-containing protein n=1 Tax=Adineta steineri TaxID=433720 RepID=A0A818KP20_9BILA|nr:unnamed protein product [Adineta steineri]